MQIDISQVKWDDEVQNPITPKAQEIDVSQVKWDEAEPKEATEHQKEEGVWDKVSGFFKKVPKPNTGNEKLDKTLDYRSYLTPPDETLSKMDEDKKVDKDTLYAIESLARTDKRLVGDATPEQKENYLLNVAKVLNKSGYQLAEVENGDTKEYIALDAEGNQKEITNNFFNSVVDGLLSDKYETGGALAGAKIGYDMTKAIPSPWTKALGILGGGAIGAMVGTAADTAESTYKTGQEFKIEDFFNELNKSAALDVAGTVAGAGVVKIGGKLIEIPKQARDFLAADNIDGAKQILKKITDYSDEQIDAALQAAKQQYKEVDQYAKSGITNQAQKQEALLAAAQSDKKIGSSYIHDVILDDKDAAEAVAKTVDTRTKNLIRSFEDVAIDGTDVKKAVEGYEKQVAQNYGKMRDTFKEAFENVDYAFDLKALKTDEIMSSVVDDIVNPYDKDVAKNLLTKVEKIVGEESGITRNFDNLVELRQVVNDFYARAQKSLSHDSKEAFTHLKKNIDTELYSAIDKNIPQEMQKPLKDMFDGAIKEYRDMYAIKDTKLYKSVMDEGMSAQKRMDALINHTADDEAEFATLLQKLPRQEQEKIENSITKAVLDKNIMGQANELQVVDYKKAVATLSKLEDFMITPSGKESVRLIKDMAEKFGDDFELMRAANQAGVSTNAGIATTIIGRLEYKLAKNAFDRIMRLVPFSDTSKRLALQKHLTEALKKSRTPMDMAKRVAGSADIPKSDKADLLEWARDFNRANSVKNEQQAQKLLLEIEAKEAAKAQAEAEAKVLLDDFDAIDPAEILAVQKLGGYDALAQTVKNLQNPTTRTVDDVKRFVEAKAKIDPKRLEEQTLKIKHPLSAAQQKIDKLLQSNSLEGLVDETTLKALQYDIKQGSLRNDKLKDAYKNLMELYDVKAAQKSPQELLQLKEVELKNILRKAEFEESVDDVAAAAAHRQNATKLQSEIEELRAQIPTRSTPQLSSQAQRVKDTADMNYHDSEDEAAQAVKDLFKKNTSEEKRFANMSDEDMAEWERIHGSDTAPKKPSHIEKPDGMSDEDWAEANMLFSKGIDNLAVGAYAGIEQDEDGNITFDPAKFVMGLGGYTAVKTALKNKQVQGVLKEYAQRAVDTIDMNPAVYKENGFNAMAPVKSKVQKEMRGIYNVQNNGKASTVIAKDIDEVESALKFEQGFENSKTKKGYGALHIEKHIGNDKDGWVSHEELMNIGKAIRKVEPYEKDGKRVYEYYNNFGDRFRLVVGDRKNAESVISFFSNRKAGKGNNTLSYIYPSSSKESIVPQTKEEWNKNLMEWHKESHPLTKNEDGTPKVFYHGTGADFSEFKQNNRGVFFVSPSSKWVDDFIGKDGGTSIMPVHIKASNPFDFDNKKHVTALAQNASLGRLAIDEIKKGNWSRIEDRTTLETIKKLGFDGVFVKENGTKNLAVFDPTQIKSIHNRGTFDGKNPNILYSTPNEFGVGFVAGVADGVEYDENGNMVWNQDDFVNTFLKTALGLKAGAVAVKKLNPKLYNNITGVGKQFPNMATSNPKLLSEIFAKTPNDKNTAGMFAGTKAIKADIGKLDDAMKLMDDGTSEADVWKKTGWFKGDDGKWRFEIDDSKITYKPIPMQKVEVEGREFEQNYADLSEIIDHPELFEKYPELKDMIVSINDTGYKGGSYNAGVNMIALNKGNLSKLEDKAVKAIRKQIIDLDKNPIDKNYAKLNAKFMDENTNPDELMAIDAAISKTQTAKKISELQTELYKAMDNANKSGAKVLNSDGKSVLLHEVQHAIQEIENFARGGNSTSKEVVQKAFENLYERYGRLPYVEKLEFDYLDGNLGEKEFKNKILDIANSTEETGLKGYLHDIYKLLHGEAEARLTQKRAIDGYEKFPYDDLDVPRDELIKKFDGGEVQMSQAAKAYKDAQGFYSVLEKTIDEKVGGKIDSNSLKSMLEKNGVKQDEIEWSGLKELMESKEKLTKEQIQNTINDNRLAIEKVSLNSEDMIDENLKLDYNDLDDEVLNYLNSLNEENRKIAEEMMTLFDREKLTNGSYDNQWDKLLQEYPNLDHNIIHDVGDALRDEAIEKISNRKLPKYSSYKLDGGENYRELLFKTPYTGKPYKSDHWDEGNILVFTRVDDRKIDGKNTLFIEELQSDWHQEGRKLGYKKDFKYKSIDAFDNAMKNKYGKTWYNDMNEQDTATRNLMLNNEASVPSAPFKKNWHELGLKRMVQEAVANDYDKIAWTTGKQQAERYSLEKTVDTVVYNKDAGVIQATNGSKEVFFKHVANEEEIEDIMGKELTARLLDKKNTTTDSVHVLQGKELKFGGEGMQAFYDEIVPNAAKKLFKKWGVKPKMEELDDVEQMVWSVDITPAMKEDVKKYGQPLYAVGGAVIANEATKGEEQ